MREDPDDYLQDGSPFLREMDLTVLDSMIRLLFLEQDYDASQAIARELSLWETTSVLGAIEKNPGKHVPTTQEQLFREMAEYSKGFLRPFRLLQLALLARRAGLEQAKKIHSWRSAKNIDWHFEHENFSFAFTLLQVDPSGVRFINQFAQKEVAASTNLYYKVGIEAARKIFCLYTDILATLLPDSKDEDEEDSTPLLPRLDKREEPAPPQQVAPPPSLAEEVFVKLAAEEEPSFKTIWATLPALFRLLVRQPRHIRALFATFFRLARAFARNPHLAAQRLEGIDHVMSRIHDIYRGEQTKDNALKQLSSEMNDFVGNMMPYPPYPAKSFVWAMQHIQNLKEHLANEEHVALQLLEAWERLAAQRGLEQYSALWTIICIASGDFSRQQLLRTFPGRAAQDTLSPEEKRYINAARWAYAKPLESVRLPS